MENNNIDFEVIISTCDKFSDLWEANVLLLNKNWKARGNTYLVTDKETDIKLDGVKIVSAGEGVEITKRLEVALKKVQSKYILFTLDDYFLTEPIDHNKLQKTIHFMERESIDYVRLYSATPRNLKLEGAKPFEENPGFYLRDISKGTYKISLYPGLWKTDFMRQTLSESMNAWQYEVALTEIARQLNARCVISNHNEFPFLDVVRKGKILRKANKYLKKNSIYHSEREVMSWFDEWKIGFKTWLKHNLPRCILKPLKYVMIKSGKQFFSPLE